MEWTRQEKGEVTRQEEGQEHEKLRNMVMQNGERV